MVVAMADGFRESFAPGVPAAERRRLVAAERARDGVVYAAFAALVAVLFGVAGLAVLLSGAAPGGASRAVFDAVAGGGALLVAVAAGLLAARGGARAVTRRVGEREDRYVGRHRLAELARDAPELGALAMRAQTAADRIRSTTAFGGPALNGVVDADGLDRIEWAIVGAALRRADPADLKRQVDRLDGLADSADRIDRALATAPGPDGLSEDLDRAHGAANDVERYLREK
jgi:hypothetical protein